MTEMELSENDAEKLERIGYSREKFSIVGEGGILHLRNVCKLCYFFDSAKRKCRVYARRPLGCRLYPIVYSLDGCATVDPFCPMTSNICQEELRAKESELIKLVKTIENEAVARQVARKTTVQS
jgi:hypothetical protein